ncbi:MAG: hypothetical protein KGY60_12780 [Bacteroidales bacterium]|nr:hypothetical protein [Bacteroidales bacterium]
MLRNILIGLILFAALTWGCEKDDDGPTANAVNIYRLSDYKTAEGSCRIIDSTVKLDDHIIVPFDQMIAYNKRTHTFTVTDRIAERLNDTQEDPIHSTAFAVIVDREVIYTGYFWAGYSSASCDWVTIDPLNYGGRNELKVSLGYPAPFEDVPDRRNDKKILKVFRLHGKLRG